MSVGHKEVRPIIHVPSGNQKQKLSLSSRDVLPQLHSILAPDLAPLRPSGVRACGLQTCLLASQVRVAPGSPGSLGGEPGLGFAAELDAQAMLLGGVRGHSEVGLRG